MTHRGPLGSSCFSRAPVRKANRLRIASGPSSVVLSDHHKRIALRDSDTLDRLPDRIGAVVPIVRLSAVLLGMGYSVSASNPVDLRAGGSHDLAPRLLYLGLHVADATEQASQVERLVAIGAQRVAWDSYPDDPDFVVLRRSRRQPLLHR
jgi:hypothetical protein